MASLDFICIGAAKSGTTTLFEYMKEHPEIRMPGAKEVPFFSDEAVYEKGFDWYMRTYFPAGKSPGVLLGTITPQYMLGKDATTPGIIAERIHQTNPDTKLIALLRNPISRSYSHFNMTAQRGHITESFDQATRNLLAQGKNSLRNSNIDNSNNYLLGSEYGHALEPYFKLFPAENILILFTEDLQKHPAETLKRALDFLDVDSDYQPDELGKVHRKGGQKAKIKILTPGYIYKIPGLKSVWKKYTPHPIRKKIEYSINLWNIKPGDQKLQSSDPIYQQLREYFAPDVAKLEELTQVQVPWSDWK